MSSHDITSKKEKGIWTGTAAASHQVSCSDCRTACQTVDPAPGFFPDPSFLIQLVKVKCSMERTKYNHFSTLQASDFELASWLTVHLMVSGLYLAILALRDRHCDVNMCRFLHLKPYRNCSAARNTSGVHGSTAMNNADRPTRPHYSRS